MVLVVRHDVVHHHQLEGQEAEQEAGPQDVWLALRIM
jgi:hypothetical protein